MKKCEQFPGMSVFDHGLSVRDHLTDLISYLKGEGALPGWKIPDWINQYRKQLLSKLLTDEVLEEYCIFHDLSKPFIKTIDENGKAHFPNHALESYKLWTRINGDPQVGELILHDMDIHLIKAIDLPEFCSRKECISLLLTGLSEIHSNSIMFGGTTSTSFLIKFKQIDKRGKAICKMLFDSL